MAPRWPGPEWLAVLGSGICFLIADGCTYSFGMFYTELSHAFGGASRPEVVALVWGLLFGLPQMSGPLVCPLIEALGPFASCLLGCVLVSASFAVGSTLRSLGGLLVAVGVVTSIGLELLYATALSAVLSRFRRRRGLATGVTVFCGGVGALLFAELYTALERRYLWRGTMLVEAGVFTHAAVAASLYRLVGDRKEEKEEGQEMLAIGSSRTPPRVAANVGEQCSLEREWAARQACADVTAEERRVLAGEPLGPPLTASRELVLTMDSSDGPQPRYPALARFWTDLSTSFLGMRDPALWRGRFLHFRVLGLLQGTCVLQPWVFLHTYAMTRGFSLADANHLLSAMGVAYALGQVALGALADVANAYLLYGVCLSVCGLACLLLGVAASSGLLVALGVVFGAAMGGTMALYSLLLVDLVGEQRLYPALGVFLPFVGVGNLVGSSLSAWLASVMSYASMFLIGGSGLLVISGLFVPLMVQPLRRVGVKRLVPGAA